MAPSNSVLLPDAVIERLPFLRNANTRFFDFGNVVILDHSTAGETTKITGKSAFSAVVVITDEVIALASFNLNSSSSTNASNQQQLSSPTRNNSSNNNNNNQAPPIVIPHTSIVGVARDGNSVLLRNSFMNDVRLTLPKTEAFIVHLIGIQDRAMNRTLRLAGGEAGTANSGNNNNNNGDPSSGGNNNNDMQTQNPLSEGSGNNNNNNQNNNNSQNPNNNNVTYGNYPLGLNLQKDLTSNDPNAVRRALSLAEDLSHGSAATEASMERLWGVIRLGRGSSRAGPPTTELDEGSDASSVQTIQHIADSPREHDDDDDEDMDDHHHDGNGDGVDEDGMRKLSKRGERAAALREEAEVPAMVTDAASLKRRLWYFFMYYDQSRLQYIESLVAMHSGTDGKALMKELEQQYGPEPHRFRWSIRDQTMYQREINSQLRAQLARAQDELLLLKENPHEKDAAIQRVLKRKEEIMRGMMMDIHGNSSYTGNSSTSNSILNNNNINNNDSSSNHRNSLSSHDTNSPSKKGGVSWQEMFDGSSKDPRSASASSLQQPLDRTALQGTYHILSFHDVFSPSEQRQQRAQWEWTVIVIGTFWSTVKQQVAGSMGFVVNNNNTGSDNNNNSSSLMGTLKTTKPLIEITNEDSREMLVCNRDFFLAWLAESHGDCCLHVRHIDGSFCFMSLAEAFRHVVIGGF